MRTLLAIGSLVSALAAFSGVALAQTPSKKQYTLFNPTPKELMREFKPDRPGSTTTVGTIDAGRAQFEFEIFGYEFQNRNAEKTTQIAYPSPTMRLGLTNNSELQIALSPYLQSETRASGAPVEKTSGMGDALVSYKYNLRGNEGEAFGWALMPALKVPVNTGGVGNNKWEPSISVPLSWSSESGWAFSILPELAFRKNVEDHAMHAEFNYPLNISHNIAGPVDGFGDFVVHTSNDRAIPTTSYFGAGLTLKAGENTQYDFGCNFGLNPDTPDYNFFVGWSFRP